MNKKEVSAFELTNYFLKRISKFDSKLNSLISMNEENALKKAKEADELISKKHGLLTGIPIVHKDLFSTKGILTT